MNMLLTVKRKFLRPSLEKSRSRVRRSLKSILAEIRIVNPLADDVAEELAALMEHLLVATPSELDALRRALAPLRG